MGYRYNTMRGVTKTSLRTTIVVNAHAYTPGELINERYEQRRARHLKSLSRHCMFVQELTPSIHLIYRIFVVQLLV